MVKELVNGARVLASTQITGAAEKEKRFFPNILLSCCGNMCIVNIAT